MLIYVRQDEETQPAASSGLSPNIKKTAFEEQSNWSLEPPLKAKQEVEKMNALHELACVEYEQRWESVSL